MLAGEVHYFRLDPGDWADRLGALRDAGCDTVATYMPWVWHEKPDRSTDLSDLVAFLDLAQSLGLWVIARPGPYVMAELQNEGIPPRVALDTPSLVPTTWDGSPVPNATLDLLAPAFLSAVDQWYAAVMPVLAARQVDRGGPIIAVQLDNEVGMLPWVTNAPPFFTSAALPDHISYSRSTRTTFAAYLSALRGLAERYGVTDVPFLINVHGTSDGRARTFGIGLSQLRDSYHGQPGTASGTDLYLGDLTVTNLPDLWVANAFTAATNGPDQPLTSLEFECGSGDYADDLSVLVPPSAVELKTRLSLAQGNRLLNYYLFAGGLNPSRPAPAAVPGTSLIAITGKRHGFAAPIDPEGRRTPGYDAIARVLRWVQPYAALIADSQPVHDDVALGLVRDHYLTEYRNPASPERGEQVADLERFRGMGPR
ncbi:beta-galactosidase, partial [Actinoplanes sp. NPDC051633]|uniref:beta-galactosidase n=1 Tax=Actinoplanes sp. NPDC051633 TaxID=3155670 RepID=UPI003421C3E9